MTLRITLRSSGTGQTRMQLEGRFRTADLAVLESCLAEVGSAALSLDLAELRWLDPPAVERLSALVRDGARIVATSPFVDRLMMGRELRSSAERDLPRCSVDPRPT